MTESKICTCPSGDGSLRWPCPAHPAVDQADVAAKLTFINGRPAMCGCQVEYSDGGGEYSDVIYVTLCAKHSGSAILDLVATNRIALTPEYEGQWHADLYLDREIPLAKVEGATPAEAVLALMSAERIDPEQESVEQAGGDRWDALQSIMEWTASENIPDERKLCLIRNAARAALAQPSPKCATCNDSGQIVVSGPHYQGEFQPPEYETEPCDMCAQPSPAQAEQAEAERPEVAEVAFVLRNIGAMDAEDIDGDNVDLRFEDAEGRDTGCDVSIVEYAEKAADLLEQQDRIVGELRADRDSWAEQAEQRLADWDEMRKERDAALARVAEMERQEPVATVAKVPGEDWNSLDFHRDPQDMQPGTKLYAAPVAQAGQVPDILTEDDMKWLRRFAECCEDSDAGGHDLPKAAVKQLVQIGALRHSGPGRQETTAFGDWLLDTTPVQGGFTNE
ncbi:hypothetical protein [Pseudomonas aeruginosa]|uniref:hypothetical protein n=1 Tax=Pseudomonas aeruginosa TaxID=287 RepID=UPI00301E23DE